MSRRSRPSAREASPLTVAIALLGWLVTAILLALVAGAEGAMAAAGLAAAWVSWRWRIVFGGWDVRVRRR